MNIPAALLIALIQVESGNNDKAVGRNGEVGCLQVSQAVVTDVNRILKRSGITAFQLGQMKDRGTAIYVCQTWLKHYCDPALIGHEPTCVDLAACWHCGPQYALEEHATARERYWEKVKTELLVAGRFDLIP